MQVARLMLEKDVLSSFYKLPKDVQKRVSSFIQDFENNPEDPRLYVHKLDKTVSDPKVRGAKLPGGYRAILIKPEKGNTWLLVYIDSHDKAYDWARNKRFEVHERTGIFQIFNAEEVDEQIQKASAVASPVPDYPIARLTEDQLFDAGVPRPLIPAVKQIQSDESFDALAEYLPLDCRDVLTGVAAGMRLDDALATVLGSPESVAPAPSGAGDFSHIAEGANYNLVLLDSDELLKEALEKPIDAWRVFLHPAQRRIVERVANGALKITGAAGTGKTVALMHRSIHLAKNQNSSSRILFLTFTINLRANIEKMLQDLAPELSKRVDVVYISALARQICREQGWEGKLKHPIELHDIWEDVQSSLDLEKNPFSDFSEVIREFETVIDPCGIDDEDTYLTVRRTGRGRLSRAQRRVVWTYVSEFYRNLKKLDILTPNMAIKQARLAEEREVSRKYSHVLVDEVQDLGLEALRLVRAISPIDGEGSDPLTLAGDAHQRIYGVRVPLSKAGIEIRGRSVRLRVNYRTSQEIRIWAQAILEGQEIDDLDNELTDVCGDRSAFRGPTPVLVSAASEREQAEAIRDWVNDCLKAGIPKHEICITPYSAEIVQALSSADIDTRELLAREADLGAADPAVRIGAMERIKGLEFRAVALACADKADAINHLEDSELSERCLRYVAATRARERLLVVQSG